MKKRFTILIAALMLLTMISQPTRLWGQTKTTPTTSDFTWPTPQFSENFNSLSTISSNVKISSDSQTAYGIFNKMYNNNTGNTYAIASNNTFGSNVLSLSAGSGSPLIASITKSGGSAVTFGAKGAFSVKVAKTDVSYFGLYADDNNTAFAKASGSVFIYNNAGALSINNGNNSNYWVSIGSYTSNIIEICVIYNNTNSATTYGSSISLGSKKAHVYVNGTCVMDGENPKAFTIPGSNLTVFRVLPQATSGNKCTIDDVKIYDSLPTAATPTQVATPEITLAGGTYTGNQTTTITCGTAGASIYYTLDGSVPTTSSTAYSSSVTIDHSCTLKAKAFKDGLTDSEVASTMYTIKMATPSFSPAGGTYDATQSVTLSSTAGATIYYTLDGSTPTTSSTEYSSAISVSSTKTIKALAVKANCTNSDIGSATYTLKAQTPTFSPAAGTYLGTQTVSINCATAGVTIYYTTNGDTPTTSSSVYSSAISVSSSQTLKAIAVKSGLENSSVGSAAYTINHPLTTMDAIFTAATTAGSTATDTYITLGDWVVSGVSGKTSYVTDNAGKGFIAYYNSNDGTGFAVGNILSNTVHANLQLYKGAAEFTNLTTSTTNIGVATGGTITPITNKTIADLSGVCTGGVYTLSGLTYNSSTQLLSDGVNTIKPFNQLYNDMSFDNEETYNVTGVYCQFGDTKEILPRSESDIVVAPGVSTSVSSISDFTYNYGGGPSVKSFTISGANLTDDVTVTASSNYKVCKTSDGTYTSSVSYEPSNGALASTTVYVRLDSGLPSNTYEGTVTVASTGATSKEIALTGTVKHTITISSSIANGTVSSDPSDAAVAGATVTLTAEPESSNYVLNSFTVTKAGGGTVSVEDGEFTMPSDDVTVSATFDHVYHVYYNANGGTGTLTDSNNYTTGDKAKVKANSFVKDGYTFHHWDTKDDDTGTDYNPNDDITIGTADVTLYAQWSVKSYNVALSLIDNVDLSATWGTSGELAEGEDDDIDYGTEITLSASNMDAGKVFIWAITDEYDNDVTEDVLDGDVLTVPAYDITIGGQVAELFFQYSGELTEGDYIIARNSKAMNNTVTSNKFGTTSISSYISGSEVIVANAADYTWHVAKIGDSDYWTIKNGSNFAASTGTKSQADLVSPFNSKCRWSISGTSTYTIVSRYNDSTSVNAYLRLNSSDYACYANSNSDSYFYKKASGSKHTVDIAAGITYGDPSASPSKAYEGQTVALTANPSTGYMLESWDVYKTGESTTKVTVKNNSFVMPGYDVTVSATYREQHTYTLVDGSTVTLVPGKHYIIASTNYTNYYVMGAQNGSVRNSIPAELNASSKIKEDNDFYEVVISGDNTNNWTMYSVKDEGYLYATGANSANINVRKDNVTTNPTYGQWTISVSSGTATITSAASLTYKYFKYNYNGGTNPRFACYSSGQTALKLYVRDGDKDLEFHSPTTIASATIAADETYTVEKGQTLTITTLSNKGDEDNLIIEDGGQLITSSTGVKATVKKEIEKSTARSGEGWYTIASSVSTPAITSGTNLTDGTYDLYRFNETEQSTPWENYKAHNSGVGADFTTLENGRGYLYRNGAKKTLTFAGALNVGTVDYAVTNSGGTLAGVNLVGNPYSHNITLSGNTSLLDKDKNALDVGSQLTACYTLTNAGGWEPGQLDDDDPIKPSQGFLIEVPEDAKTISFSKGAKKDRANNEYIKFIVENSNYSDVTYALFDKGLGLSKIDHRNPAIPMIYIPQGKEDYAVAIMKDNTETFGLNIKVATTGLYTLKYKTKGEFSYLHVIDRMTGEDIDMLLNGEYSFFSSTQDDEARFIVRLAYKPNYGNDNESVFAYQSGSEIFVSGEGELQVFDVLGRFVMSERINGVKAVSVPAQGVYVFRLVGENVKTQKIVIR